jgi:hypothetical protein
MTYNDGSTTIGNLKLKIFDKNNQFIKLIGYANGCEDLFVYNKDGLHYAPNYLSNTGNSLRFVTINNVSLTYGEAHLIKINPNNGEVEILKNDLLKNDRINVNFNNILLTPSRWICFKGVFVPQNCFILFE